jgi:hypothetical protein
MSTMTTIQMKKLMKHLIFFASFIIIVSLAFGSKGGDKKDKRKNGNLKNDFVPVRIASPFNLKSGFIYSGSYVFSQQKEKSTFSLNTIVTYQRGNTTYILPFKYRVNTSVLSICPAKNNLQMLDLKISMHK